MLAASVWCAINNAVASLGDYQKNPELTMPATPEAVLKSVMRMQGTPWEVDAEVDTDTVVSLIKGAEENSDLYNDKVMPQDVRHAKDIDPAEVEGRQVDDQPEAIEHPNVAGARGPAHSE
jgi:xanthine dehydrogenase large subunit